MKISAEELRNEMMKVPEISQADFDRFVVLTKQYAPIVLPRGWTKHDVPFGNPYFGMGIYWHNTGLQVLFSADHLTDPGKVWLHVLLSRKKRVPTYDDMKIVKELFIGPDRQALQIFPPENKHVNFHPYCLHLWCCINGDGLPDFGRFGTV